MEPRLLALLAALAASAIAGPISLQESTTCATECLPTSSKFSYAPGTTYLYDYSVETATSMAGASEESAKLLLTATVELEVLAQCEMMLSLKNTRLSHTEPNREDVRPADREDEFGRRLESSPLRFSFQDGAINHVCPGDDDDISILNIKKGIISSFQNSMRDLSFSENITETDIAGTCPTVYEPMPSDYFSSAQHVSKVKDVLACTDRHSYDTLLQMVPYNTPSEIQSLPLMKTTHQCEQKIQGGVLQLSSCTESHVYRPFSNGQSGGATVVKQTLTYKTFKSGVYNSREDFITKRDTLVFDHSSSGNSPKQARHLAERNLKEICEDMAYGVTPESPRQFSQLVMSLKSLDKDTLQDILWKLKDEALCPNNKKAYKAFLDAIPVVGTGASVGIMTSLIMDGDMQGTEARAWIISLAFIKNPTAEMLREVKPLIDDDKFRQDSLLPVSAMVNNFCSKTPACDGNYEALSIMASMERFIGPYCDASGGDFYQILLTLRAMGNAGHMTRAVPIINRCLTNGYNPVEIKVAAAEAFRNIPCDAEDRDRDLWATYENPDLDSELRIAAYRALMRCPSDDTLDKMASSLRSEQDEQVGSFVQSHLNNLRETSDPHKQDVVRRIDDMVIPDVFESNPLKTSTNLEASALINKINTGFVAESDIVFSHEAHLPRSAAVNLTVELFGQSINLVDFGARFEGFEALVRQQFGPVIPKPEKEENIKASAYGRIFGHELLFLHSRYSKLPFEDTSYNWLEILMELSKDHDKVLTHSQPIMNARMTIPTVAGLPINIDVNGSAVVDLVLKGKADFMKMSSSPRSSLDIDGEIRPSAALEITGTMSVDAIVAKTGLRMRNTLHTSTAVKGRVQLSRGKELTVELDTPQDSLEIFDASSKFFIVHNEIESEQNMIAGEKERKQFEACTSDKLQDITGAVLCGKVTYYNTSQQTEGPYFPLNGPSSARIVLTKKDNHSGYKLLAKKADTKTQSVTQISFNTPGSHVNRLILVGLTMNYADQTLEAQVVSPWKKAEFKGSLINGKSLRSVSGELILDDRQVYGLTSELKISRSKGKLHLSPMIKIRSPGMNNIQLSGFVAMEETNSVDIDMSLTGLQKMPYTFKTSFANKKQERRLAVSYSDNGGRSEYSVELRQTLTVIRKKITTVNSENSFTLNTPKRQLVAMEASVDYKENKLLKLDGSLDIHKVLKKPVSLSLNAVKTPRRKISRLKVDGNIRSSAILASIDSYYTITKDSKRITGEAKVTYSIPRVAKSKFTLSGKFNDKSTKAYTKYAVSTNLEVKKNPEYNVGLSFDFDHKRIHSEAEVEILYGANHKDRSKRVYLNTQLQRRKWGSDVANIEYSLKAEVPEKDVDVVLEGAHAHSPKKLDSNVRLNYGKGKEIKTDVVLKTGKRVAEGVARLEWPGSPKYKLSSKLEKKKNGNYEHDIELMASNGLQHNINTVYRKPSLDSHSVVSTFNLDGAKKTTVSGLLDMDTKEPQASAEFKYGKDVYGISTRAKLLKSGTGQLTIDMQHPERRVVVDVDSKLSKDKINGSIVAAWDADKDKSKKISMEGLLFRNPKKSVVLGGYMSFTSPFNDYENLAGTFRYTDDDDSHDITGKYTWGSKQEKVSSSLAMKKPVTLKNLDLSFKTSTPFRGMRVISADVVHNWDDALNTMIVGKLSKETARLSIQGEGSWNNLKGSASLSSTIKNAEDISGSFEHKHGSGNINNKASLLHNGKPYGYDFNMDHSEKGWRIKNNGNLLLQSPKTTISSSWDHENTIDNIKSGFSSQWGKKEVKAQLTGSHDLNDSTKTINGELKFESPWKSMRDVVVSLNHRHGDNLFKNKASLTQNGDMVALSDVKYTQTGQSADLDFKLVSPLHEDISVKLNTQSDSYPMMSSMTFQWHPRKSISAETSLNVENLDNSDMEFKLSTPFRGYRNIVARASNKREGTEMVSRANLDYGKKKRINLETRHDLNDQNKMARVKLTTPFDTLESLETGLKFDGHSTNFVSKADFELVPLVGKFQGSAEWRYDGDLNGKLRVDTPYPEFPYLEVSALSKDKGKMRESRAEVRMHQREVYSLDAVYSFELPISFEATVRSPYPDYDNLGLMFRHKHSPSSVASSVEVRYHPEKKIEADLKADWSKNVEGSLNIYTPFSGYESNKIFVRHRGALDNFKSHGEVNVAKQSIVADASFDSGKTTKGTFSLETPIPSIKNIYLSVTKKGGIRNIRSSLNLILNEDAITANYNHRLTKQGLKGSFKLDTPFTEQVKLSLEHNGQPEKFTNEISASYGRKYDVDSVISFVLSKNDVTGDAELKYKLGGRRNTARLNIIKNGALQDMTFSGTTNLNNNEIKVSGSWKNIDDVDASLTINTPFQDFKETGMSINHRGSLKDFTTDVTVTYMDDKTMKGKVDFEVDGISHLKLGSDITIPLENPAVINFNINHNYEEVQDILDGYVSLRSPSDSFGSREITYYSTGGLYNLDMKTSLKKEGEQIGQLELKNFMSQENVNSKIYINFADPIFITDIKLDKDDSTLVFIASTQIEDESFHGEVSKVMDMGSTTIEGMVKKNNRELGRLRVVKDVENNRGSVVANVIHMDKTYDFDGELAVKQNELTVSGSLDYSPTEKIRVDFTAVASEPSYSVSASINSPYKGYETLDLSASLDKAWPIVSFDTTINNGEYRHFYLSGSLDASSDISGNLEIDTPIEGFPNVGLSFDHSGELGNSESEGRVDLKNGQEIYGKLILKLHQPRFHAELRTPFLGYETMMTSASYENSWPKVDLSAKVIAGDDKQVSLDVSTDASDAISASGSVNIKTPLDDFSNIGASFKHSGGINGFESEGQMTYMDGKDISSKVNFFKYMWRRLEAKAELSTPFTGASFTKAELNFEDNSNSISTSTALQYGNDQTIKSAVKVTYSPNYEALVTVNTPFEGFREVRASTTLDMTAPSYSASYSMNRNSIAVHSANAKLNIYSENNVDGSLELVLPIMGFEFTRADYQHKYDTSQLDGFVSLTYGDSETMSAELKASSVPNYDATLTIKTPFEGYENIESSSTYDDRFDKFDVSSSLKLNRDEVYSFTSALDLSNEPYRATAEVNTPFNDYSNMQLVLTHEGSPVNFYSTGLFSSPLTDDINAEVIFKYNTPSDMEASAAVRSSFEGMDNLLAAIKNSEVATEKRSRAVVGWTRNDQIVLDGSFDQKETYNVNKVTGELSLSTPFEAVSSLAVEMEHSGLRQGMQQKMQLSRNRDVLLDLDAKYSSEDKHQATVTFRKPVAMMYTVEATCTDDLHEAEIVADWNRDDPNSNVRIVATVNDKSDTYQTERSLDVEVEHAARKVGVSHKLSSSQQDITSSGKIFWDTDENSQIFYDMQIQSNTRRENDMTDGYFALGLPTRTLKLSGSHSGNQAKRNADMTFSWNTDRSDKQIGLHGSIARADTVKGDITLKMPAIRKEIRVDGELMAENGRVILDARTDISYSQDSRKTLTLTSKLEDISDYYSRYNYSLAVGVSHPYTNVDIQMTSHMGSSDEKMTLGVNTDYLTARRQTTNLGLLAEINKLKRQINVQVENPINKIEIIGDVVSTRPCKMRMRSKVDDVENFRSDLTVDEDKKSFELNLFEGQEGIKIWMGYPNQTAFRSEVHRISYGQDTTESLLAVRLNTTRLMHTRLHWNPELIQQVLQEVKQRADSEAEAAIKILLDIEWAVAEEVASKHADIAGAIQEDWEPVLSDLKREINQVARDLKKLSDALKQAYDNNEFYLQDMGDTVSETYNNIQDELKVIIRNYKRASSKFISSLNKAIQDLVNFPIKELYGEVVGETLEWLRSKIDEHVSSLEILVTNTGAAVSEYYNNLSELKQQISDKLHNSTLVDRIVNFKCLRGGNMELPSLEIPQEYAEDLRQARDAIRAKFEKALDEYELHLVNEIYQQILWAHNYWQLEENVPKQVETFLRLFCEIVRDELRQFVESNLENPITVWDPEHGEVQAEIPLPVDVERLDQIPDLRPLADPYQYLPM